MAPIEKWNHSDFLPTMPTSFTDLDLLLMTVKKNRIVRSDGIHLFGLRYLHQNLTAFIGEDVCIRYDPRDVSEIRIYKNNKFLCIAVCTSLERNTIGLKEIERERNNLKRELKNDIGITTEKIINNLKEKSKKGNDQNQKSTLKRYKNDE